MKCGVPQAVLLAFGIASIAVAGVVRNKDDAYETGLALWRKPDKLGHACASCHSADGIELAVYNYDLATIRRRATPHLGAEDAAKLGQYFVSLR